MLVPPLIRRHVLRHGHDVLVAKITLLANVSRVRMLSVSGQLGIYLRPSDRLGDRATLIGTTIPNIRDSSTQFSA